MPTWTAARRACATTRRLLTVKLMAIKDQGNFLLGEIRHRDAARRRYLGRLYAAGADRPGSGKKEGKSVDWYNRAHDALRALDDRGVALTTAIAQIVEIEQRLSGRREDVLVRYMIWTPKYIRGMRLQGENVDAGKVFVHREVGESDAGVIERAQRRFYRRRNGRDGVLREEWTVGDWPKRAGR